ncbi:MAG: coiled-coil domain-containing protein [Stackebrandtia sp.]
MTEQLRRRKFCIAAAAACVFALYPAAEPAYADPEDDDHSIEEDLEEAIEDYIEAEEFLEETEDRQKALKDDVAEGEKQVADLSDAVNEFAAAAYRSNGVSVEAVVLTSGSTQSALEGLAVFGFLGEQSGAQLQALLDAQADLEADKETLDEEVEDAEKNLDKKEKARDELQAEVDAVNGPGGGNGTAEPAPRNPDGSWPDEGCTVDDPTTGGCLTPRMNHAYEQAQNAGYTRYTSCWRDGGGGEHPLGRACDMAASEGGFGGAAQGEEKTYGDNLAGFFVDNADALGVMYVIWYNQFWDPGSGWGAYSGGNTGNPSSDHTNHVHISIY